MIWNKQLALLILLLVLVIPSDLFAQRFKSGAMLGISTSQVEGDLYSGFRKAGPLAGLYVYRSLSEKSIAELQIYFIQKGSRKNNDPANGDIKFYLLRLNYIEIPLLYRYQQSSKLSFEIGPAFGTLLSAYEEDENGETILEKPFNDFELSGQIGINYQLFANFILNTKVSYSLIPIREPSARNSFQYFDQGQFNSVIAFALKYEFGNGKTE
ncbi:MAG: PorT family protein [Bacteroidia bacterium]|nr:PorT family protein [Bacteroidia bacterium]